MNKTSYGRYERRYNIIYSTGISEEKVRDLVLLSRVLDFIYRSEEDAHSVGDKMTIEVVETKPEGG